MKISTKNRPDLKSGTLIGTLPGYGAVPAGPVVKTCHQVGLVSRHVALTVALEPGTLGPGPGGGLQSFVTDCSRAGIRYTYTLGSVGLFVP